jgi:hypothetical protein
MDNGALGGTGMKMNQEHGLRLHRSDAQLACRLGKELLDAAMVWNWLQLSTKK